MDISTFERVQIESTADLWDWLERHGDRDDGVLLVTFKKHCADRYVGRDDVLDALIAHGWIDGRRFKLDDDRTMQLVTPRRQQRWAQTYVRRAERLESEGRMRPAGRAALEQARRAGTLDELADVDRLEAPDDLVAALERRGGAREWWESSAPSYRRNVLRWVASAKRPRTRADRIERIVDHAARGEKVPNY